MSPVAEIEIDTLMTQRGPLVSDQCLDLSRSTSTNPRPWKAAIDKLSSWWTEPIDEEDGYVPPCRAVLATAIEVAQRFQDENIDPPHRVVQDAGGGIIFERRIRDVVLKYHFWSDGKIEYIEMRGHKVTLRRAEN